MAFSPTGRGGAVRFVDADIVVEGGERERKIEI
jgi:hypothetical protein